MNVDSSNDADLVRDLRIFLIVAQKNYVRDAPLGVPPAEGVLDYGVLGEPAYVTWAGLMGREDTR